MERYDGHEPIIELDGSAEAILVRTVESFQTTHREVLENVVMHARRPRDTGGIGRELLTLSGRRMVGEFRLCVDLIGEVESAISEQDELLTWLLGNEQQRRLDFINFYTNLTGLTIEPKSEDEIRRTVEMFSYDNGNDAPTVYFHQTFNADAERFVQAYRQRQT